MAFSEEYRSQVQLLIRTIPFVFEETCFALKGGTAINLFVRDMPRLSVDIDLTYLPVEPRKQSLAAIDAAMKRIGERVRTGLPGSDVTTLALKTEKVVTKLLIRAESTNVKIEVTPVTRGCVFEPEMRSVTPAVESMFGFAEATVVSFQDLYAGKLVAALDRQHPRDLFDIRELMANEGITDELRRAFIVYMLSHNRPMHEVLSPRRLDFSDEFIRGFQGMTAHEVTLDQLHAAREQLFISIVEQMPNDHKRFLISFEKGTPDWELLGLQTAAGLPAVLWRRQNLNTLSESARGNLVAALEGALSLTPSVSEPPT